MHRSSDAPSCSSLSKVASDRCTQDGQPAGARRFRQASDRLPTGARRFRQASDRSTMVPTGFRQVHARRACMCAARGNGLGMFVPSHTIGPGKSFLATARETCPETCRETHRCLCVGLADRLVGCGDTCPWEEFRQLTGAICAGEYCAGKCRAGQNSCVGHRGGRLAMGSRYDLTWPSIESR